MTIRFETRTFEFSHGRKPRGNGYWLFQIDESDDFIGPNWSMSLTHAKAWMRRYCKVAGIDFVTIKICP